MRRYLEKAIYSDLKEKMVFLGGPRQVGKTTLAFQLAGNVDEKYPGYLNWDVPEVRRMIVKGSIPSESSFIILDEIHKYKAWRNLVKGFYDTHKSSHKILVTGSARLDYYRRGGDSLQGRYHYYRLHPLSLYEINANANTTDLEQLLKFGGFPEPFLKGEERHWKRWQQEKQTRVIHEDLVSIERVRELSQMSLLADILPEKVGSVLSLNSLREDLSVAFETVDKWVQILENLYFCYRISPLGVNKLRTSKKEKKLYLWDWSLVPSKGARFENLVASHLMKYCHFQEDVNGERMQLTFLRDRDKREIDFIVLKNGKPLFAVECKTGEEKISPHLSYFAERTSIPQFYQVHLGTKDYEQKAIRTRVIPFTNFSKILSI